MLSSTDKQILKKLIARDEAALFTFYSKYKAPLKNFLSKQLEDRQDLEEVVQDSFLAFFEALRDFRGKSSLKTFLFAIAKRRAIDKLRGKKVKRILFSRLPESLVDSMARVLLDDEIDRRVIAENIEKALEKLPDDYVRILRLKYWSDLRVVEIADELSMSFKAAESLLFRARRAFIKVYRTYE